MSDGELGWLIEKTDTSNGVFWLRSAAPEWTQDANKALHFHRRQDANEYFGHIAYRFGPAQITEHIWLDAARTDEAAKAALTHIEVKTVTRYGKNPTVAAQLSKYGVTLNPANKLDALVTFASKLLIYTIEDDDRVWCRFGDEPTCSFKQGTPEAALLLRIEAARADALHGVP